MGNMGFFGKIVKILGVYPLVITYGVIVKTWTFYNNKDGCSPTFMHLGYFLS